MRARSAGLGNGITRTRSLQLGVTHRRIRRDRKHQPVDLRFAFPVAVERLVEDFRVLLVLHQLERPGAYRIVVHPLRRTGLQHRVGIFRRKNSGEVHAQIGDERRLGAESSKRTV